MWGFTRSTLFVVGDIVCEENAEYGRNEHAPNLGLFLAF